MDNYKIKLYKYGSEFDYLKNYCAKDVWLPPIRELNDPFENRYCSHHPNPLTILNSPKLYNHYFQNVRKTEPNLTEIEFKKFLESEKTLSEIEKRKYTDEQFMSYGILSLTTNPQNIPMWAYYAKNHQGYCIEFELDFSVIQKLINFHSSTIKKYMGYFMSGEEILSFGLHDKRFTILKVIYSEDFPSVNIEELLTLPDGYERNKLILKNVAGTKYKDWAHEDDFRIITNINSKESGLINLTTYIPFIKFSGVIIGSKISSQNKTLVTKLFNKFRFNYYQTNLVEDKYEITISRYKEI